jgi:SAM-dependent methyltransferase
MDVFGKALKDFYHTQNVGKLWIHNNYGKPEEMPVEVFFRLETDLSDLDEYALRLCKGNILDVGAGVGAHSFLLQSRGLSITALEISESACDIMKLRGIRKVVNENILFYSTTGYDTILMLMNGIGLCGDINGLNKMLPHLKTLIKPGGQLILDSSDISYLYDNGNFPKDKYYGELVYQYEYQHIKGDWFKWLYIDFEHLKRIAESHALSCELLYEDDMDQFLARLTL